MQKVVFVLAVLFVCGFGGIRFYLPKFVDERIRDRIDEAVSNTKKQSDFLAETVKDLEIRLQKTENRPPEKDGISGFKVDFNRWNCWCDLKNKLRRGGECSDELGKFNEMFSDCPDLLKMVNSIVEDENNETKDNSLTNNLLKFVRLHNVDENKLDRITGYVLLLSIRKAGTNE